MSDYKDFDTIQNKMAEFAKIVYGDDATMVNVATWIDGQSMTLNECANTGDRMGYDEQLGVMACYLFIAAQASGVSLRDLVARTMNDNLFLYIQHHKDRYTNEKNNKG